MARLGIPPHIADKILNHQAGTISGVAAVYQRHDFLAEREEALDRWGVHVEHVVQKFRPSKDEQSSIAAANKIGLPIPEELMKITAKAVLNQNRPHASPHPLRPKLRIAAGYLLKECPACV